MVILYKDNNTITSDFPEYEPIVYECGKNTLKNYGVLIHHKFHSVFQYLWLVCWCAHLNYADPFKRYAVDQKVPVTQVLDVRYKLSNQEPQLVLPTYLWFTTVFSWFLGFQEWIQSVEKRYTSAAMQKYEIINNIA